MPYMAKFDASKHPHAPKELKAARRPEPGLESLIGPTKPVHQPVPSVVFTFDRKPLKLVERLEQDKSITF